MQKQTIDMDQVYALADLGFRLHPLSARSKVPLVGDWTRKASTDREVIATWAKQFKDTNWGVATGLESGIFVVDIDPKNQGTQTWAAMLEGNKLPKTLEVVTGSLGTHLYFKYPTSIVVSNSSIGKGIDIRGEGGNIVVPPSIHANGNTYLWKKGRTPDKAKIANAPSWLLKKIKEVTSQDFPSLIGSKIDKGARNNTIYHQSLLLARQGALFEFTLMTMKQWVKETKEFDMREGEIRATVESAYKYHDTETTKKKDLETIELSDVGNTKRLLNDFGDILKYAINFGYHTWDGMRWFYDKESLRVKQLAIKAMDNFRDETLEGMRTTTDQQALSALSKIYKWTIFSHNTAKLSSLIDLTKSYPQVATSLDSLDAESSMYLLNFNNGTLDLLTGTLRPHNREDLLTRKIEHDYDPKAKCPNWLKTLDLAFNHDKELIDYFKRAVGYSISGDTSEQCFFICWGSEGNNGKSTMLEAIQDILGNDYATISDAKVISSKETDNYVMGSLAKLNKIRFVSINEFGENAILDEELIKQLTGGDTLQAKILYQDPFAFKPIFKLWVRANAKPIVHGTGNAFWRRVKLIPFEHTIPPEHRKPRAVVDATLRKEAAGIIAWMIEGFHEWKTEGGLRDPQKVVNAAAVYRSESDSVNSFWEECIDSTPGKDLPKSILYSTFRDWSQTQGVKWIMTSDKFSRRVSTKLNQFDRARDASGIAVWKGISLNKTAITSYGGGF